MRWLTDKLSNLIAGLGTSRDKAAASTYADRALTDYDLTVAYRNSWLPRKIVDIPALDACRKWRQWNATPEQITAIEAEEQRLGLRLKVREALTKARLYGGCGIIIGDGSKNAMDELRPERIGRGGLKWIAVVPRQYLTSTDLDRDPESPWFMKPKSYQLSTGERMVEIHPSRVVAFIGADYPDQITNPHKGWGDSILQAAYSACINSDSTLANVASLVFEAKVDVIKVPRLTESVVDASWRSAMLERMTLAATGKGINGCLLLDSEEEYEQKNASFGGLDAIIDRFTQVVSGAADIPITRLMGQSPAGLNSTGESDLRNYYDMIQSLQELEIQAELAALDECLIRSALGSRPPEVHYNWRSLWQTTEGERANVGKTIAETGKILTEARLVPPDALAKTIQNALIEAGVAPGLEQALEEFPESEDPTNDDVV